MDDGAYCSLSREEEDVVYIFIGRVQNSTPVRRVIVTGGRRRLLRLSKNDSKYGLVVDFEVNGDFLMPHYKVCHILAVEGVDVLDNCLEDFVGSVYENAPSRSTMNERVDIGCCTPRTGLLLTHPEFSKLDLCSPGAHAACHRDSYRCSLDNRAPFCH